jgi:hypothetical protein
MTTVKKVKTAASVFELPQRLVLQYVEYEQLEKMREPPQPALVRADPVEELLKEWPELGAFGADRLRAWAPYAGSALWRSRAWCAKDEALSRSRWALRAFFPQNFSRRVSREM